MDVIATIESAITDPQLSRDERSDLELVLSKARANASEFGRAAPSERDLCNAVYSLIGGLESFQDQCTDFTVARAYHARSERLLAYLPPQLSDHFIFYEALDLARGHTQLNLQAVHIIEAELRKRFAGRFRPALGNKLAMAACFHLLVSRNALPYGEGSVDSQDSTAA